MLAASFSAIFMCSGGKLLDDYNLISQAAMVKIEYSENPDFTGSAGTGEQLPAEGSGYSKHQANVLKPDTCNYCRALMETIDE